MSPNTPHGRRRFLQLSSSAWVGASLWGARAKGQEGEKEKQSRFEFCTFTKPFQHMSYAEVANVMALLGFEGIEAPVRPGGHVVPEKIEEDLPRLVEALKEKGLGISILTSGINEVSEAQFTEKVLSTAASLGVKRFRMAYYRYDLKQPVRPQLENFKAKLRDLVPLCRELGIKPIYQNHSGRDYFGAPVWDMTEVFSEFDPADIGIAFDIGHATIEGAKAWPLHFASALPWIDSLYLKEAGWVDNKLRWTPLGEGAIDPAFYEVLKQSDFSGPVSVHVEYFANDPALTPQVIEATRKDLATAKQLLS